MTDATRLQAPACLDIKSANLPLVALMLKSTDLQAVQEELNRRLGDVPDFFDNEPLLIDLSGALAAARRAGHEAQAIDFSALLALLAPYKVKPIAAQHLTQLHKHGIFAKVSLNKLHISHGLHG